MKHEGTKFVIIWYIWIYVQHQIKDVSISYNLGWDFGTDFPLTLNHILIRETLKKIII